MKTLIKTVLSAALSLALAVPAFAGNASPNLGEPQVVPASANSITVSTGVAYAQKRGFNFDTSCDAAKNRSIDVIKPTGGKRCPINFDQRELNWLNEQPTATNTYIFAVLKGEVCAIPASFDERRDEHAAHALPNAYPWKKICDDDGLRLFVAMKPWQRLR